MVETITQQPEHNRSNIDDRDVVLTEVSIGGVRYRAAPPLRFGVEYDSKHRAFEISGEFNIYFSEPDRESMLTCLNELIEMLWNEVATEDDDDKLTKCAQALRDEMRERLRPEDDA